jgi:hypothetical protein
MHLFPGLLFLFLSNIAIAQTSWYVDFQNGSNQNSGTSPTSPVKTIDYLLSSLQPKDTVFIMGQYNNPSYDPNFVYGGNSDRNNPHIWHKENTIRLVNLHGAPNQYITFKPYDNTTVLKGDGANIFRVWNCSYIRIEGLEIYGEVNHIPLSSAEGLVTDGMQFLYLDSNVADPHHPALNEVLFRVTVGTTIAQIQATTYPILGPITRPSYIDTRGLYVSGSHHIDIIGNHIHHTPGGGLRVSDGAYVNIIGNEIHDCSRRSYSGTHALVVTKSVPGNPDPGDDTLYTIRIERNMVHHNFNEIFSWVGTKSIINPRIDEGKGISLQRNNIPAGVAANKRILAVNNICYWNGFSGVHSNDGYHIDFINNTCYMNSYTNTITYTTNKLGKNIGISAQGGADIRIINNISVIDTDWNGYAISVAGTANLMVSDNLIFGVNGTVSQDADVVAVEVNTTIANPMFTDAAHNNFRLKTNSPAIGIANTIFAPPVDYYNDMRDNAPDLGAIEYGTPSAINEAVNAENIKLYPNPFQNKIVIEQSGLTSKDVRLYNLLGQDLTADVLIRTSESNTTIETSDLPAGMYVLRIKSSSLMVYKSSER